MKNVLVTGGCGFIGSNFINYLGGKYDVTIVNVDRIDYCSDPKNITLTERYHHYKCDINNIDFISYILNHHSIDTIVHFAAQSHVDNSFGNSLQFTQDNVLGSHSLLECCRIYGKIHRYIHISTDEVYGEIDKESVGCMENCLLDPTNPYAATKAGAEFITRSYYYSYHLPIIIIRGNNVYGPRQYPEKIIPKFIYQLLHNQSLTIHGKGESIRNFIHVEDFTRGVLAVIEHGKIFQIYNIGTTNEYNVLQIAQILIDKICPHKTLEDCIYYVEDRLFNDKRYCIDASNLKKLGWKEEIPFDEGLDMTIAWYKEKYDKEKKNNLK